MAHGAKIGFKLHVKIRTFFIVNFLKKSLCASKRKWPQNSPYFRRPYIIFMHEMTSSTVRSNFYLAGDCMKYSRHLNSAYFHCNCPLILHSTLSLAKDLIEIIIFFPSPILEFQLCMTNCTKDLVNDKTEGI